MGNLIFNLSLFSGLGTIAEPLTGLFLLIDGVIYGFIGKVYGLFLELSKVTIFGDSVFTDVANRIYVIISIVMLFAIIYNLMKSLIDPDQLTNKDTGVGKLLTNIVTSLVLITFIPTIFSIMYDVQSRIVDNNVIGKLILGSDEIDQVDLETYEATYEVGGEVHKLDVDMEEVERSLKQSRGSAMSFMVLNAFLNPENKNYSGNVSEYFNVGKGLGYGCVAGVALGGVATLGLGIAGVFSAGFSWALIPGVLSATGGGMLAGCGAGALIGGGISGIGFAVTAEKFTWDSATHYIVYNNDFGAIQGFSKNIMKEGMTYTPLLSSAAGLILLYLMVSFCLDLGVRIAKLALMQIIAPIPILFRIIPGKNDVFNSWVKKTTSYYLEIFIRIIIMFLIVYLISHIEAMQIGSYSILARAIIILGLVTFAKQAPKLIAELFGLSGDSIKLGIGQKIADGGGFLAAGVVGAGLTGLARNAIHGANKFHQTKGQGFWKRAGALGGAVTSAIGGAGSGAFRGGKATFGAKNIKDVKSGITTAAADTTTARDKRDAYQATHRTKQIGNVNLPGPLQGIMGVATGHVSDTARAAGRYIGIGPNTAQEDRTLKGIGEFSGNASSMKGVWEEKTGWKTADEQAEKSLRRAAQYNGDINAANQAYKSAYNASLNNPATYYDRDAAHAAAIGAALTASGTTSADFTSAYSRMKDSENTKNKLQDFYAIDKAKQLAGNIERAQSIGTSYADVDSVKTASTIDTGRINHLATEIDAGRATQAERNEFLAAIDTVMDTDKKAKVEKSNIEIERTKRQYSEPTS